MLGEILIGSIVLIVLWTSRTPRSYHPMNLHQPHYPRRRLPAPRYDYHYDEYDDYDYSEIIYPRRLSYHTSRIINTLLFVAIVIIGILYFGKNKEKDHIQTIQYPIENMYRGNSSTNY